MYSTKCGEAKGNSVLHSVEDNKKNNTQDACNNKAKTRETALGLFFDYLYLRSTVSRATLHVKETAGDPLKALVSHTVKMVFDRSIITCRTMPSHSQCAPGTGALTIQMDVYLFALMDLD